MQERNINEKSINKDSKNPFIWVTYTTILLAHTKMLVEQV
jgi:hypothetical protein